MAGTLAKLLATEGLILNIVATNKGGNVTLLITPKLEANPEANITPITVVAALDEVDLEVVKLTNVVFSEDTQTAVKTANQVKDQLQKELAKAATNPTNKVEVKKTADTKTPLEAAAENGGEVPLPPTSSKTRSKAKPKAEAPESAEQATVTAASVVASLGQLSQPAEPSPQPAEELIEETAEVSVDELPDYDEDLGF